jgi:hypothetical protein
MAVKAQDANKVPVFSSEKWAFVLILTLSGGDMTSIPKNALPAVRGRERHLPVMIILDG